MDSLSRAPAPSGGTGKNNSAGTSPAPGPRVLKIEIKFNERRILGFADVELPDGTIIRSMRIIEERGDWPQVVCPQISVKLPGRPPFFRTVITLPAAMKRAVDFAIFAAFREKLAGLKENDSGRLDQTLPKTS